MYLSRSGIAQLTERPIENRLGFESPVRQGIYLPESAFTADSLTVAAQPPRVQSHASTTVRTLKISNTGSHTLLTEHENTTHTDRNG